VARRYLRARRGESELEFARVVAFSDGVFAIAITLLVLTIEIPEHTLSIYDQLLSERGDLLAFALSFAVLAKLWGFHHRFFAGLGEFDQGLIWLNFAYLAFITLVPFSCELIGDYYADPVAIITYAANMAALGIVGVVMTEYSFRRDLVKPEVAAERADQTGPANWIVPGIFLASVPAAFISPFAAIAMWLLIFFVNRRSRSRLEAE